MVATIKQISEILGVSKSTVSRALSGNSQVSESTRQRVIEMARRLDYYPNIWAQTLTGDSTNLIGCLVLELTNPFYVPVARAIEDIAKENNYLVFLGESRRDTAIEKDFIDRSIRTRVAGVIITPVNPDQEHLKILAKQGIPVTLVARYSQELDSVDVDNLKSGDLVAEHFLSLGHKKIGYIQSGNKNNRPERDRLTGLNKHLSRRGGCSLKIYNVGNNQMSGGEIGSEYWLQDSDKPSAVFCSNDMLAMGFVQALLKKGVEIPGDVSVIGHDDNPFAENFIIPLTTIVSPKYDIGRIAATNLLKRINSSPQEYSPCHILLEPSLILRRSCN